MFKISIIFFSVSHIEKMISRKILPNVTNKYLCEINPSKLNFDKLNV